MWWMNLWTEIVFQKPASARSKDPRPYCSRKATVLVNCMNDGTGVVHASLGSRRKGSGVVVMEASKEVTTAPASFVVFVVASLV